LSSKKVREEKLLGKISLHRIRLIRGGWAWACCIRSAEITHRPHISSSEYMGLRASKMAMRAGEKPKLSQRDSPVDRITEAQLQEFQDAFHMFDKDWSGTIEAHELKPLCEWVGQEASDDEVATMIRTADADGTGKIDFWEFVTLMAHKMGDPNPDITLQAAFQVFDTDGDGTISKEEIRKVMREMGENLLEEDMDDVLSGIDRNGDDLIRYDEFARVVTKEIKAAGQSVF
jgi:calmodulin